MQSCDLKSAESELAQDTGHYIPSIVQLEVIGQEDCFLSSKIRKAIIINLGQPAMNRDQGHHLHPILYGTILQRHQNEAANTGNNN